MKRFRDCAGLGRLLLLLLGLAGAPAAAERVPVTAVGLPLADHYAGIVAYEKYRDQMTTADYRLKILPGPHLVRAYFFSKPDADLAFNVAPMVMDMFATKPIFRWISLIHRDGNALAVNTLLEEELRLPMDRRSRLPDDRVARAIVAYRERTGNPVKIAIPSPQATHTTILYKYLRDHDLRFGFRRGEDIDVLLDIVNPPDAPVFLKKEAALARPAGFEQGLPWPEVSELEGNGRIAWYSKNVMNHEHGHVECIIIAKDEAIRTKRAALEEVIRYIHRAGRDIEAARREGGEGLREIVAMIRRHVPAHTPEAIAASLRPDLDVINYRQLRVDANAKASFREIMELAFEGGFIAQTVDIDLLADESFNPADNEQDATP